MMSTIRSIAFAGAALFATVSPALAAELAEIDGETYYGAAYFANALEHPKVAEAGSEKRQLGMVARDMGWKRAKLAAAVEKVRSLDGKPLELAQKAIKAALEDSRIKGRVVDVTLSDARMDHVVCTVVWKDAKKKDLVKEASTVANLVAKHAPFVETLGLAARPKTGSKVWQREISRSNMERIDAARIDTYGERLYAGSFEEVAE